MLTYAQPDLPAACSAETLPERWRTDHGWQLSQHTAKREETVQSTTCLMPMESTNYRWYILIFYMQINEFASHTFSFLEMQYTPDASTLLRQMPLCLHVKRTPWSGELEQDHRTWTRTSNPQNQTESCSVSSSYHHWREDNKDWSLCAYIQLLKHQQDVLTSVKYWSYYAQACFLYCWDHFVPIQSTKLNKNLFPCISVEQTV